MQPYANEVYPPITEGAIRAHYRVNKAGTNWLAIPCPAHNGTDPNCHLSWHNHTQDPLAKCHSQDCDWKAIIAALRRDLRIQPAPVATQSHREPPEPEKRPHNTPIAIYAHPNPLRPRKKVFREDCEPGLCRRHRCPGGTKHIWQEPKGDSDGYHILIWQGNDTSEVVLVEGEKAAKAVQDAGITAACWMGGSSNVHAADYSKLAGKRVVLWPDDDEPGRRAMNAALALAAKAGADSFSLIPSDGTTGQDAADFDADTIRARIRDAHPCQPEGQLPPPTLENANTSANAIRVFTSHAHKLAVAFDLESEEPATIYAARDDGRLSKGALVEAYIYATAGPYWAAIRDTYGQKVPNKIAHSASALCEPSAKDNLRKAARHILPTTSIPGLTVAHPDEFDAQPHTIGTLDGVLDIRAGRILPPDEARATRTTATANAHWRPQAQHPAWDAILAQWRDAADYLAYALTHKPRRDFGALITAPGAGKTAFVNALQATFGPYIQSMDADAIRPKGKHEGRNEHNGELLKLRNPTRVVFAPEISAVDKKLVAQISGADTLQAREIRESKQTFTVNATLILVGNRPRQGEQMLGLGGEDNDTGQALLERIRPFVVDAIPDAQRVSAYAEIGQDADFRDACFAGMVRLMQQALDATAPPPPDAAAITAITRREWAGWQVEWLPNFARTRASGEPPLTRQQAIESLTKYLQDTEGDRTPVPPWRTILAKIRYTFGQDIGPLRWQGRLIRAFAGLTLNESVTGD